MVQIIEATFKNGVFTPDKQPDLSDSARVRLVIEPVTEDDASRANLAWARLEQLWATSTFNSLGNRLTREQLHDRD